MRVVNSILPITSSTNNLIQSTSRLSMFNQRHIRGVECLFIICTSTFVFLMLVFWIKQMLAGDDKAEAIKNILAPHAIKSIKNKN